MNRSLLFFVPGLMLISCSPVQASQVPTETAIVVTNTFEPTVTSVPSTPTFTPDELLKARPEIVAVEQYDMPEEQARKLEEMNVSFQEITQYVDGVLVRDNETNQDAFYFDRNTEILVDVNTFEGTSDVDNITETISDRQLRSEELTAWLYYKASKLEFDKSKVKDVEMQTSFVMGIEFLTYTPAPSRRPNFDEPGTAPFERNPGALMNVSLPDEKGYTEHMFMPCIYFDKQSGKLYPVKTVARAGAKVKEKVLHVWRDKMNITLLVVDDQNHSIPSKVTEKTKQLVPDMERRFRVFSGVNLEPGETRDLSALSDPKIVVESFTLNATVGNTNAFK